ncbi:carbohydrate binding domain-containing protein, partial [Candidatus Calescamantes bacterium]|nr:carbohydrate binding domain-containing protein [Candidatus Calescamantes bacterium]
MGLRKILLVLVSYFFLNQLVLATQNNRYIWIEAEKTEVNGWIPKPEKATEYGEWSGNTGVIVGDWPGKRKVVLKFGHIPDGTYAVYLRAKRHGQCSGNVWYSLDRGQTWKGEKLDLTRDFRWHLLGKIRFSDIGDEDFQIKIEDDSSKGYALIDIILFTTDLDYFPPNNIDSIAKAINESIKQAKEKPVEIVNGGFEGKLDKDGLPEIGWILKKDATGTTIDNTVAFRGKRSLKISIDKMGKSNGMVNTGYRPLLKPGTVYRVEGYIKTENVAGYGATIFVQHYTNPDKPYGWVANLGATKPLKGTNDWTKVIFEFITPKDSKFYLNLQLSLWRATGTVWFDEIKVYEGSQVSPDYFSAPERK